MLALRGYRQMSHQLALFIALACLVQHAVRTSMQQVPVLQEQRAQEQIAFDWRALTHVPNSFDGNEPT
jgi:hypothetical protein